LREFSDFEYVAYYLWTFVDDDYIFALLNNNDETSTVIDVFDWNGNFKKELVLDKGIIDFTSIDIDPVNKYLYIITLWRRRGRGVSLRRKLSVSE
jgi:hypothetical protein